MRASKDRTAPGHKRETKAAPRDKNAPCHRRANVRCPGSTPGPLVYEAAVRLALSLRKEKSGGRIGHSGGGYAVFFPDETYIDCA